MVNWVAVGTNTRTIAYSNDAEIWTTIPNSTSIFNVGSAVVWNGTLWVAVGEGTNTIAYSSNAITWTGLGTTIISSAGNGITNNSIIWIAKGYA